MSKKENYQNRKASEMNKFKAKSEKNGRKVSKMMNDKTIHVIVSDHAIDRVSTRHEATYKKYREHDKQGIMTWMRGVIDEMIESGHLKGLEFGVKECGVEWVFRKAKSKQGKTLRYILVTVEPKG